MLIWDDILEGHNIRIDGAYKGHIDKYLGGDKLPNKNVTVEQAELISTNYLNNLLSGTGYEVRIHIFSFPKKTEETVPFVYTLNLYPAGSPHDDHPGYDWWEDIP